VVAPPYDVIKRRIAGPVVQETPRQRHPLILNRDERETTNRTTATREPPGFSGIGAARDCCNSTQIRPLRVPSGLQLRGPGPYATGLHGRIRLERFAEGKIYPHEETHASAKADRFKLTVRCRANLSQIFGLYPDEDNAAQGILERSIIGKTPLEASITSASFTTCGPSAT